MTDLQRLIAPTCDGLADRMAAAPAEIWDAPSLCEGWQIRHVIAHVTMPARLTVEEFMTELVAVGGDFSVLSNSVAHRDAPLPTADHLAGLRSPQLHAWQPPGGGASAALSHAVIHSLDATVALDQPAVAPIEAVAAVLDELAATSGSMFGLNLEGIRLVATDVDWSWGDGDTLRAESGPLVALLSGRTLPDGRSLQRASHD
jgi:uncharacterized protein (TIGR03083 family)